jgi:hypothetical protein
LPSISTGVIHFRNDNSVNMLNTMQQIFFYLQIASKYKEMLGVFINKAIWLLSRANWPYTFTNHMSTKHEFQHLLGKNLRRVRLQKMYTVEQLGLESGLGYSQVSRIELGKRNPTAYTLFILSKTLDINPSEFFKSNNEYENILSFQSDNRYEK